MSLNVLIDARSAPVPFPNESFVISQGGVSFDVECGNATPSSGAYYGSGLVFLSAQRLVVVVNPRPLNCRFISFGVLMAGISSAAIHNPWFGSKNITFRARAMPGGGLAGDADIKIKFDSGGASEFFDTLKGFLAQSQLTQSQSLASSHSPLLEDQDQGRAGQDAANQRRSTGGGGGGGGGGPVMTAQAPYYPSTVPGQHPYIANYYPNPPHRPPQQQQQQQQPRQQRAYIDPNDPTKIYIDVEAPK